MQTRSSLSGLAALLLTALTGIVACSGDPGSPIPPPSSNDAPPAATDAPPPSVPAGAPSGSAGVKLTVTVAGTGRVVSQPAGIDCPGQCSATVAPGAKVSLVSTPAEGWRLDSWGGACSGSGACSVVVAADTTVTSALSLLDARWDPAVGAPDCAAAWGAAGEKLSPCDTVKDDYVVVHKSKRNAALCKTGKLVKNLRSGLGSKPTGPKLKEGDGKTPEGVFFVPRLIPNTSFYKALGLSYPTIDDAARGVTTGLITASQRSQIESAHAACVEPPQNTALGGDLEVHGSGGDKDWTAGDVALDDPSMDLLWSSVGMGDTIVIVP